MTAEIAVLNRLGVALAADSAVTISGTGSTKVFNTADKLFELSDTHPIAIMINDNMDCFGIPWEIVIKDFRSQHGRVAHPNFGQWVDRFLEYVESRSDIKSLAATRYLYATLFNEVDVVRKYVNEFIWVAASSKPKRRPKMTRGQSPLAHAIGRRHDELKNIADVDRLAGLDVERFVSDHSKNMHDLLRRELPAMEPLDKIIEDIIKNIKLSLIKDERSAFSSGVIFAGYGSSDDYPSVISVDINGFVIDRLKYTSYNKVSILSRHASEAGHVVTFAQTDVADRLLEGVDPKFNEKTVAFFMAAARNVAPLIVKKWTRARGAARKPVEDDICRILSEAAEKFENTVSSELRSEFRREFEQMIGMMPKVELIEFAEALVSITAIERKATSDQGTVGGPIDVAFINKHEGFVWIKRKHYFAAALNPRYFWRKYPQQTGSHGNVGTKQD